MPKQDTDPDLSQNTVLDRSAERQSTHPNAKQQAGDQPQKSTSKSSQAKSKHTKPKQSKSSAPNRKASLLDRLRAAPLYVLPHHLISRIVFKMTRSRFMKNQLISGFIKLYKVDMAEAVETDPHAYPTFNAFFTRQLKPGARAITPRVEHVASPVDGTVSEFGAIDDGTLVQAKGRDYTLLELLGGDNNSAIRYLNGSFITIYLSPRDYHRVHMPLPGKLISQTHVPGRLFSVAPHTVRAVKNVFARNERLVCQFENMFGGMTMVMVGAINVAAIETVWDGLVTPPAGRQILNVDYTSRKSILLAKGDEMGRFNMGSTVILLFDKPVSWHKQLAPGKTLRMGQPLALMSRKQARAPTASPNNSSTPDVIHMGQS